VLHIILKRERGREREREREREKEREREHKMGNAIVSKASHEIFSDLSCEIKETGNRLLIFFSIKPFVLQQQSIYLISKRKSLSLLFGVVFSTWYSTFLLAWSRARKIVRHSKAPLRSNSDSL
jgi:hypothetical protein